ncbi:expansin EXLX1 family cellulose-binding protein [Streptomyces vilmorinianum]|uniref:expansin EXLX1 family cellulose-binding protein n=1 Tax=Streptomyces vilmorinianum TaxID=3051092 RepID=UPI0010FB2474|nr:expansin EXLX1 family cellulose-binding protein [Streptomyces vilmorinianum]
MMTARQAARRRRRRQRQRQRLGAGAAVALAAAGVIACLVMASAPDRETGAASVAVAPGASTQVSAPTEPPTGTPPLNGSPTPTGGPDATGTLAPTAGASTTAARPSATKAPRTTPAAAPAAGRIQPGTTYQGVATVYEAGNGDGSCLFGPSDSMMIAAMNTTDYESSRACGAYVLVRAANGNSVTVRITNECPLPCAPGQLDLSEQAFAKLVDPKLGRIPITWSLLSPRTSDTISIRYKVGSSPYWCGIQAIGHRNPLARLEVRGSNGWRPLPRTDYNYFLSADGSGCGGAIRITDIYGERLTVDGIALRPNVVQPTQVQFVRH